LAERKISKQELEQNNGKDGKPAYFAYKGKVYEVTDSAMWMEGEHMGMHQAGKDLTDDLDMAPHSVENFERVKYVGELES
jgi:predicted heme/steroid binding protein